MNISMRTIRRHIAAFSVVALFASLLVVTNVAYAAATDYADVNGDEWYVPNVDWGLDNGVLDATQLNFRPGDNILRQEFFKEVAVGGGIPEEPCDETLSPDMHAGQWGCGWATALANAGVISGDSDTGNFRLEDPIVRAEAGKVASIGMDLPSALVGVDLGSFGFSDPPLGSDKWTDSVPGAWYEGYLGDTGATCVFRGVNDGPTVEPGRNIVRAEAIAVVNRATMPNQDCLGAVTAGALTVTLDSTSPPDGFIPKNAANVIYSAFRFTASGDEDIELNQLVLSRDGLGLPEDFDFVILYDQDGNQVSSDKSVNTSTNTVTFTNLGVVVPAGGSVVLTVRADMASGLTVENSQNRFCIADPIDVVGTGTSSNAPASVGGSFAICGATLVTTSAEVGNVTYEQFDNNLIEVNVGDLDVLFTKVRYDVGSEEDIEITWIQFENLGSSESTDFAGPGLYVSGIQIADETNATWNGDYLAFDLSDNPLFIERGNSKTVNLQFDQIVGGIGDTAAFSIDEDWHTQGIGLVYGYGPNFTELAPPNVIDLTAIVGGNLAFSLSSNNPTVGDVGQGANEFDFMHFNISTAGDAVTIDEMHVLIDYDALSLDTGELEDVKIWAYDSTTDTWTVVSGPFDPPTLLVPPIIVDLAFTDDIDVPEFSTIEYMITADVDNLAPAGAGYTFSVDVTTVDADYVSNGDPVLLTDITGGPTVDGNKQTVAASSLDIQLSSTPGDQTVVRNQQDSGTNPLELVGFDATASTVSDLLITNVTITCDGTGIVLGTDCDDYVNTAILYQKQGSTYTALTGAEPVTAGIISFTNVNHWVPAGNTHKLVVRANISSSAQPTDFFTLTIASITDVSVEDVENRPATVTLCDLGTLCNTTSLPPTPDVTIANNGALTVSVDGATPLDDVVLDNTAGVLATKLRFRADDREDIKVRDIRLTNLGPLVCDDDAVGNVVIRDEANGLEYNGTLTGGQVEIQGMDFIVPRNSSLILDVYVDTNDIGAGGANSADCYNLYLNDLEADDNDPLTNDFDLGTHDLEAVGVASGILLESSGSAAGSSLDCAATGAGAADDFICTGAGYVSTTDLYNVAADTVATHVVYNNIPTFSLAADSPQGDGFVGQAGQIVFKFDVSVEGAGQFTGTNLGFTPGGTCGTYPASYELFKAENTSVPIANSAGGVSADSFEALDFTNSLGIQVSAGTTQTYVVKGNTGLCTTDQTFNLTLEPTVVSPFGWDDDEYIIENGTYNVDITGLDELPLNGGGMKY